MMITVLSLSTVLLLLFLLVPTSSVSSSSASLSVISTLSPANVAPRTLRYFSQSSLSLNEDDDNDLLNHKRRRNGYKKNGCGKYKNKGKDKNSHARKGGHSAVRREKCNTRFVFKRKNQGRNNMYRKKNVDLLYLGSQRARKKEDKMWYAFRRQHRATESAKPRFPYLIPGISPTYFR